MQQLLREASSQQQCVLFAISVLQYREIEIQSGRKQKLMWENGRYRIKYFYFANEYLQNGCLFK